MGGFALPSGRHFATSVRQTMARVQRALGRSAFANIGFAHSGVRRWFSKVFSNKRSDLHSACISRVCTAVRKNKSCKHPNIIRTLWLTGCSLDIRLVDANLCQNVFRTYFFMFLALRCKFGVFFSRSISASIINKMQPSAVSLASFCSRRFRFFSVWLALLLQHFCILSKAAWFSEILFCASLYWNAACCLWCLFVHWARKTRTPRCYWLRVSTKAML